MRRFRDRGHARGRGARAAAGLTLAAALVAFGAAGGSAAMGASSAVAVTANILSHTSLTLQSCGTSVADTVQLGTVLPDTIQVTAADCVLEFGSNNDTSRLKVYQHDLGGSAMFRPADGTLDSQFNAAGTPGLNRTDWGGADVGLEARIQSDGKIVVGGRSHNGTSEDLAIARFNSDGTPDTVACNASGTAGRERVDLAGTNDNGYAMALQNERPVVAGHTNATGTGDWAAARFDTDCTLDATFNPSGTKPGTIWFDLYGGSEQAYAVETLSDNKLLLAGYSQPAGNNDFALARLTENGELDSSFDPSGTPGYRALDFSGFADAAHDIAVLDSGKILVAGHSNDGTDNDFAIARFTSEGDLDTTFNALGALPGTATVDFTGGNDSAIDISVDAQGRIVLVGSSNNGTNDDFAVARLEENGTLDLAFNAAGTPGKLRVDFGGADNGYGGAVTGSGAILAAGSSHNGANQDFGLLRVKDDGTVDATLNPSPSSGRIRIDFTGGNDFARAVLPARDGQVVLAGYSHNGLNLDMGVAALGAVTLSDFGGSWASAGFGACLHTIANATAVWTLAGSGNCTSALSANWRAIAGDGSAASATIATAAVGVVNARTNLRFGVRPATSQRPGDYEAPLVFEVSAP